MLRTLAAIAMLIALGSCQSAREQLEGDGLIVLEGATLIDGTGSTPRPDTVVVIHGTKILLVAAGMEPADVLVAATKAGATALRLDAELGTVQQGMQADLVVLGSNPLADIRNTRTIESVFLRGAQLRPSDLLVRQ